MLNINISKLIKTTMLSSVLATSITACVGSGSSSTTNQNTQSTVNQKSGNQLNDELYLEQMGSGYDSTTGTVTSNQPCIAAAQNNTNIEIANPTAIMKFDKQQGMSDLQQALGVNVTGQYGGDRFSASVAAEFANDTVNNAYTTNLIYLYRYQGTATFKPGTLGQGLSALTPTAQYLVESNIPFQTMCGDSYIAEMSAGAVLAVRITLTFNSSLEQSKFNAQINTNVGLASVAAALQTAASSSNVNADYSISAMQMGGDPQDLNDVFGQKDPSGNYPFLDCGSTAAGAGNGCNNVINAIVDYGDELKTQLSNSDGSINLNKLYYSNPAVATYSSLGVPHGAINPSPQVIQAMQTLTKQYDQTVYNYNLVNHYINTMSQVLDQPTLAALSDASQWLQSQIENIYLDPSYQLMNCYKGFVSDSCLGIEANIQNAIATNYPLPDDESKEIAYLDTYSYQAKLIDFDGALANVTNKDFAPRTCVLAPVSDKGTGLYAINCDGYWMTSNDANGLIIKQVSGFGGAPTANVSGLSFASYGPESATMPTTPQLINYTANNNLVLQPTSSYNNAFSQLGIVVNNGAFTSPNTTLTLTQWTHSQS